MPSEEHATPPASPSVPDHELLRLIGRGAYGEVWLARNAIGTLRAVKIVHRQSFERSEHFEREFKGLIKFEPISRSHEGLVHVLQIGRRDDAGYFFYVMELADDVGVAQASLPAGSAGIRARSSQGGEGTSVESAWKRAAGMPPEPAAKMAVLRYAPRTLRSELQARGALPAAECVAVGLKLAAALEHLHANGLVHRDIKPSNIIFVNGEPKLADIGLVTTIDEAQSLVGTAGYIPPEGPGTPQADLYSLGKVIYEITFGKDRQEFPQLPPDLQSHPEYTALLELNEVILKACETDSRLRYQSAEAIRDDLELLTVGKSVRQKRSRQQLWAVAKKALVVVIAVVVLTASGVFSWWQSNAIRPLKLASAQYHTANSMTKFNDWKFEEAINEAALAIKLDPKFLRAYGYYGWYLELAHGDIEAARREYKIAEQIDTNDVIIQMVMADPFVMEHKFDLAIKQLNKALRLNPQSAEIHEQLSEVYEADKQYDKAIDEHETWKLLSGEDPTTTTNWHQNMRSILHTNGPSGWWQAQLDGHKTNSYVDPYWVAQINARLGNTNEVFTFLNQAYNQHNYGMIKLLEDDHWDGYRNDPRFKRLLDKVGFTKVMLPAKK